MLGGPRIDCNSMGANRIKDYREELMLVMNPYKALRNELGLTQKDVASLSAVTPQVVTGLESGLFNSPPVGVSRTLCKLQLDRWMSLDSSQVMIRDEDFSRYDKFNGLVASLHEDYDQWVIEERGRNRRFFLSVDEQDKGPSDIIWDKSWVIFRESVTGSFRGFCRILVFQPSMMQEFEKYNRHSNSVETALIECGIEPPVAKSLISLPKKTRVENVSYASDKAVYNT